MRSKMSYNGIMIERGKRRGLLAISQKDVDYGNSVNINPVNHYLTVKGLEEVLNKVLRAELKHKVSVANYENGKLVVFCKDATSASCLRYESQSYIELLRNKTEFSDLSSIKVRVA